MCQWPPCMSSNSMCVCVHVYNCALPQHENVDINNMESLNFSLEYREYIFLHMHLEVVNPLLPKKPPHGFSHKDKPPQSHFTPPPPPPTHHHKSFAPSERRSCRDGDVIFFGRATLLAKGCRVGQRECFGGDQAGIECPRELVLFP